MVNQPEIDRIDSQKKPDLSVPWYSSRKVRRITANNGELLAKMASYGLGLTAGPLFFLQAYIDRGELIPVLNNCDIPTVGMYAVYPPGRLVSRRVKMFSDFLFEYFRHREV